MALHWTVEEQSKFVGNWGMTVEPMFDVFAWRSILMGLCRRGQLYIKQLACLQGTTQTDRHELSLIRQTMSLIIIPIAKLVCCRQEDDWATNIVPCPKQIIRGRCFASIQLLRRAQYASLGWGLRRMFRWIERQLRDTTYFHFFPLHGTDELPWGLKTVCLLHGDRINTKRAHVRYSNCTYSTPDLSIIKTPDRLGTPVLSFL